jgi:hypothetical protein
MGDSFRAAAGRSQWPAAEAAGRQRARPDPDLARGKAFMVALRLYGSETAFFDQTWKPDDVVKVK